jgi:hypothetical protein
LTLNIVRPPVPPNGWLKGSLYHRLPNTLKVSIDGRDGRALLDAVPERAAALSALPGANYM